MIKKSILSALTIIIALISFTSCLNLTDKKQTDYHEEIEDLERYILEDLGECIKIYSFEKDAPQYPSDKYEEGLAYINIQFKEDYITDNSWTSKVSPDYIINTVRERYNRYVDENKDYVLSGYVVKVVFCVPIEYAYPYGDYALISNEDYLENSSYGNHLSVLRLSVPIINDNNKDIRFGEWRDFYDESDIAVAVVEDSDSMEHIIEIADNMPFLKYIVVKDHQTADQATALRPNVKFVSVSGG